MSGIVAEAGFILAGNYPEANPAAGLESVLRLVAVGEDLGFQVAGVRQRHLERGISSALPFLAAASQRTSGIRLETDVVPLGYETPFRLAEDFATVDALARGRVNVGISTSTPHVALVRHLARPDASDDTDRYELIDRFLAALEGDDLAAEQIATPYGPQTPRILPHVRGLRDRVWLGGGSERSIRWAARRGLGLLLGNVTEGKGSRSFEDAQRAQIEDYDAHFAGSNPRVATERVIVPFEGATHAQREHYGEYAAGRVERTKHASILGERTVIFQRDLIGSADEIIQRLRDDPSFDGRTGLRIALPYGFAEAEYSHILTTIRTHVLPELGWSPRAQTEAAA